ncbi:MAG: hypothetical protein ABI723_07290 [Bacteroidia bacterium]
MKNESNMRWSGVYGIVLFWLSVLLIYGKHYTNSVYYSQNALETMFYNDTVDRIFGSALSTNTNYNYTYFLTVLDARLNLWNYFFYLSIIVIIYEIMKQKKVFNELLKNKKYFLLVFSLLQVFLIGLFLTFMKDNNVWYFTPALPFVVYIIIFAAEYLFEKTSFYKYIIYSVLIFTFIRHFLYLNNPDTTLNNFFKENKFITESKAPFYFVNQPHQDLYLHILWQNRLVKKITLSEMNDIENGIVCLNKNTNAYFTESKKACYKEFCFVSIQN